MRVKRDQAKVEFAKYNEKRCRMEFSDSILKVGTNLLGLSEGKIDALIKCAEWMTEVQIRTYLPNLIHE